MSDAGLGVAFGLGGGCHTLWGAVIRIPGDPAGLVAVRCTPLLLCIVVFFFLEAVVSLGLASPDAGSQHVTHTPS